MTTGIFTSSKCFNRVLTAFLMLALTMQQSFAQIHQRPTNEHANELLNQGSGGIAFVENQGQWPAHVLYKADVPGAQMLVTPQGMLVGKYDPASLAAVYAYDD